MSDTQGKIGKILHGPHDRDAIHIAVAPIVALLDLEPGQHIDIKNDIAVPAGIGRGIGVVDPFLRKTVLAGESFWCFLYPNTITALRHAWRHPAFQDDSKNFVRPAALEESETWLRNFATEHRIGYEDMLSGVADGYVCFGNESGPEALYDSEDRAEFWTHYETVTGERLSRDRKENMTFRCAC